MTEINRDLSILQTVSQLGPEAMVNIDTQALARKILRDGDMSPEALRTERQVAEIQEQQAQQMQAAQLAQLAQQVQNPQDPENTQ